MKYRKSAKPIIAVVDDNSVILEQIKMLLSDKYRIVTFSDGKRLFAYLAVRKVNLILLDVLMPEMDGREVLTLLRADEHMSKIPVIIMTGSDDSDIEIEMLELGAKDYISKPIRPQLLISRINTFHSIYNYQEHLEEIIEEKMRELRAWDDEILTMLARVTDLRDEDTGGHIERTTEYTKIIVNELTGHKQPESYTLSGDTADIIVRSMKLHDIGKIAIPDKILQKPGKLTEEEFEIIKKHAMYGGELFTELSRRINNQQILEIARNISHFHHEKWNGTGYPYGLRGKEIPLCARIAAISDVYDALTSARSYKPAFSHEKSVDIIMGDAGRHFDPYLANIFYENNEKFRLARQIIDETEDGEFHSNLFSLIRQEIANSVENGGGI